MLGLFFSTTLTMSSILLSRSYHNEREKLVKLNEIISNKHAKVASGAKKAEIMNSIKTFQENTSESGNGDDGEDNNNDTADEEMIT